MTSRAFAVTVALGVLVGGAISGLAQDLSKTGRTSRDQQDDTGQGETLAGPDAHQIGQGPHGHLFGDWDGARSRWLTRGVRFDFHYLSDSLANVESDPTPFANNRTGLVPSFTAIP